MRTHACSQMYGGIRTHIPRSITNTPRLHYQYRQAPELPRRCVHTARIFKQRAVLKSATLCTKSGFLKQRVVHNLLNYAPNPPEYAPNHHIIQQICHTIQQTMTDSAILCTILSHYAQKYSGIPARTVLYCVCTEVRM